MWSNCYIAIVRQILWLSQICRHWILRERWERSGRAQACNLNSSGSWDRRITSACCVWGQSESRASLCNLVKLSLKIKSKNLAGDYHLMPGWLNKIITRNFSSNSEQMYSIHRSCPQPLLGSSQKVSRHLYIYHITAAQTNISNFSSFRVGLWLSTVPVPIIQEGKTRVQENKVIFCYKVHLRSVGATWDIFSKIPPKLLKQK